MSPTFYNLIGLTEFFRFLAAGRAALLTIQGEAIRNAGVASRVEYLQHCIPPLPRRRWGCSCNGKEEE